MGDLVILRVHLVVLICFYFGVRSGFSGEAGGYQRGFLLPEPLENRTPVLGTSYLYSNSKEFVFKTGLRFQKFRDYS